MYCPFGLPNSRPPPGLAPLIIPFVVNAHPFYHTIKLRSGDPDSVTVSAILKEAGVWLGCVYNQDLSVRWITDEGAAFVPKDDPEVWSRRRAAKAWYFNKGHCLASEPIDTDESLRERLRLARKELSSDGSSAGEIRLYVVVRAPHASETARAGWLNEASEREVYSLDHYRSPTGYQPPWCRALDALAKDDSILTRMAALYDPAFAYAEKALRGLQDGISPEGANHDFGENASGGHGVEAAAAAVATGGGKDDDVLEGRRFTAQLRNALRGLLRLAEAEVEGSDSDMESKEADASARAGALGKVLQELFDDSALKVTVNTWSRRITVEAECPTPCGVFAHYIVGKDALVSARDPDESRGAPGVLQESMVAYREAMLDKQHAHVFAATCCPSLVVGMAGSTFQIYAAYLAEWVYRTHLCDFALDADADTSTVAAKVRVVRNTARMLREAYARVHVGESVMPPKHTCRPYLLPRPTILMPAPLPLRLYLLDRVMVGQYSDLYTGKLQLPGPPGCSHDDVDDDNADDDLNEDDESSQSRELPVHVKFVEKYGTAAHRLLAAHTDASGAPRPLAPQLYWAGEILPGLLMIVMETLLSDARMLCRYSRGNPDPDCSEPATWGELDDVHMAVRLLHAHGFVHGDIRDGNVMLQRQPRRGAAHSDACNGSEEGKNSGTCHDSDAGDVDNGAGTATAPRAYLIDFDWAGKEGEARYPSTPLNPDVEWPRPVSELGGQLITKDDDVFMLERLLQDSEQESETESDCEYDQEQDDNVREHKRKRSDDVDSRERKYTRDNSLDQRTREWVHDQDGQSDSDVE